MKIPVRTAIISPTRKPPPIKRLMTAVGKTTNAASALPRKHALAFYGRSFRAWGLLSAAAIVLLIALPVRQLIIAPVSLWSGTLLLVPLSGLSLLTIFQALGTFNKVDVALPKWALLGGPSGGSWAIWNPRLLEECDGLTVAVKNHSNSPVVLTMVWLEWFANVGVPTAFHREMNIVDSHSRIYHREIIGLDKVVIIKPKDAFAWILKWNEVIKFYGELLSRQLIDPKFVVYMRISVYDEYADRVSNSPRVSIHSILAQAYYVKNKPQLDREMQQMVKILEPLAPYIADTVTRIT